MSLVLCSRCRLRLLGDTGGASPSVLGLLLRIPRRCLKPTRSPAPVGSGPGGPPRPKRFIRQIDRLAESPLQPQPRPPGPGAAGLQFASRAAGALAAWSLVYLAVVERRRRWREEGGGSLQPFDFGYVQDPSGGKGIGGEVLRDLRRLSPCLGFGLAALVLGNLLRSRRLSPAALATLCRHVLDRPGRSALLTSPWLSALCVLHGSEFLASCAALGALCLVDFGFAPEEKILVFFTGALAGSAVRCAYQRLLMPSGASVVVHWQGAHGGLAALAGLLLLSVCREAARAQQATVGGGGRHGNNEGDSAALASMPRSARRILLELRPTFWYALLAGCAAIELAGLLIARRPPPPGFSLRLGACPPGLRQVTSLAGLASACGLHAAFIAGSRRPLGASAVPAPATASAPSPSTHAGA